MQYIQRMCLKQTRLHIRFLLMSPLHSSRKERRKSFSRHSKCYVAISPELKVVVRFSRLLQHSALLLAPPVLFIGTGLIITGVCLKWVHGFNKEGTGALGGIYFALMEQDNQLLLGEQSQLGCRPAKVHL